MGKSFRINKRANLFAKSEKNDKLCCIFLYSVISRDNL